MKYSISKIRSNIVGMRVQHYGLITGIQCGFCSKIHTECDCDEYFNKHYYVGFLYEGVSYYKSLESVKRNILIELASRSPIKELTNV